MPFNIACGTCRNCVNGWTAFCLRTNPTDGVDGAAQALQRVAGGLIIAGQATPSLIVSHELPLTAAPEAYDKFDRRIDGYTKVLLHP